MSKEVLQELISATVSSLGFCTCLFIKPFADGQNFVLKLFLFMLKS